jgi:hypothetical protein
LNLKKETQRVPCVNIETAVGQDMIMIAEIVSIKMNTFSLVQGALLATT